MISVLLVDDEPVLLDIGRMFLEKTGGFQVGEATSGIEALSLLEKQQYDAIVSDYEMPEMDGLTLLRCVRSSWPDLPFILFTGRGREEVVIEALNSGADFYLQKGGDPKSQFAELGHKIKQAVKNKRAAIEIQQSEETFRQFFEAAGDPIFILDHDQIVDCNTRAHVLLGLSREEVIGRRLHNFSTAVQPDGVEASQYLKRYINQALSGDLQVFEWRIFTNTTSITDTEVSMSSITIAGRSLLHVIVRDISNRKHDLKIREINELRLESMLGLYAMRDHHLKEITDFSLERAIAITASEWGYIGFVEEDETMLTIYSWSGNSLIEADPGSKPISCSLETGSWSEVITHRAPMISDTPGNLVHDNTCMEAGISNYTRILHIPVFDRDKIVIIVGVANKPESYDTEDIRQVHLLITGMWGIIRRKKTEEILQKKNYELAAAYEQLRTIEENLRESEERYRGLVERSGDLIILLNEHFIPVYISPAFAEITGYDQSRILGKTLPFKLFSSEDQKNIQHMMHEALSGKPISHFEIQIKSRDGKQVVLDMRGVPVRNQETLIGVQVIGRDITAYKNMEKALQVSNQRMTLLADLTRHDILNNLTVLGGFIDIVRDECSPGDVLSETADKAHDSINAIKYLIEFTRDYQSLGIREAEWIPIKEAFRIAASQLDVGSIQIINEYEEISVRTDPLICRAFYSLVENSLRHGKTVTRIHGHAHTEGTSLILLYEDNGQGVDEKFKGRIFERGFGSNTGLGLFLVKEIVHSTGFSIRETGVPGKGARFEIIVPEGEFQIHRKNNIP